MTENKPADQFQPDELRPMTVPRNRMPINTSGLLTAVFGVACLLALVPDRVISRYLPELPVSQSSTAEKLTGVFMLAGALYVERQKRRIEDGMDTFYATAAAAAFSPASICLSAIRETSNLLI
jgi:hypothetical protein